MLTTKNHEKINSTKRHQQMSTKYNSKIKKMFTKIITAVGILILLPLLKQINDGKFPTNHTI